jgi:hypothetical protein
VWRGWLVGSRWRRTRGYGISSKRVERSDERTSGAGAMVAGTASLTGGRSPAGGARGRAGPVVRRSDGPG